MAECDTSNTPLFHSQELISKYINHDSIDSFLKRVLAFNEKVNIVSRETSLADLIDIVADCLVSLEFLPQLSGEVFDIGSGGGFPSIILMQALPDIKMTLIERTRKKAAFLKEIIKADSFKADVINKDFQEVGSFLKPGSFDYGLMKYVKLTRHILKTVFSLLRPGGMFIYYSRFEHDSFKLPDNIGVSNKCYYLNDNKHLRTITLFSAQH